MKKRNFKIVAVLLALTLLLSACGASSSQEASETQKQTETSSDTEGNGSTDEALKESDGIVDIKTMSIEEIVSHMTLEQKASQMMIPAIYNLNNVEMSTNDYGSVLSTYGFVTEDAKEWAARIDGLQKQALNSKAGIPFLYGQDSVHGVNYCTKTVIFPHNINIGAANDPELTYQMGLAVADEMKMTKMIWNYAPCVAVAKDPRWGRTYESYSADETIVASLGGQFTQGLLDGGVIACPKHFFGDGNTVFGTGEVKDGENRLIDRGDAILTEEEIEKQLAIYQELIDRGAQSIMLSHSSLNGVKVHENKEFILDVLRGRMGFEGVIVSDWNSIENIDGATELKEQLIISVNAGVDLVMEPDSYRQCIQYIVEGVNEGKIPKERIDDAVTRILTLKKNCGVMDDPYLENLEIKATQTNSEEYREFAAALVEKSQVLLKNENNVLPLKSGAKIYLCGPAMNDTGVQCGGWTRSWNGMTDKENGTKFISTATTILEAFEEVAEEYDFTIVTEEEEAKDADVTILCVGEQPYAEWNGDTADLSITGVKGLSENSDAIKMAKKLGKPTITLVVAGRNVILEPYYADWDAVVMCGLFGSEAKGVVRVLTGESNFTGRLAMPWYRSIEDVEAKKPWLEIGYGLTY